jgi:hypothetical protein
MQIRPFLFLIGTLAAAGAYADAYTWTDETGVVHYSDRPEPGAKVIDLGESSRPRPRRSPSTATSSSQKAGDEEQPPQTGYTKLEISSPAPEETLWNIGATLNVSLTLTPALRPGHQVRVYFDGTPKIVSGTSFQLEEVYRGVHNLQAEVIDETGKLIIRSIPNRFYVQQNSIL